jgi:hypothetical protein
VGPHLAPRSLVTPAPLKLCAPPLLFTGNGVWSCLMRVRGRGLACFFFLSCLVLGTIVPRVLLSLPFAALLLVIYIYIYRESWLSLSNNPGFGSTTTVLFNTSVGGSCSDDDAGGMGGGCVAVCVCVCVWCVCVSRWWLARWSGSKWELSARAGLVSKVVWGLLMQTLRCPCLCPYPRLTLTGAPPPPSPSKHTHTHTHAHTHTHTTAHPSSIPLSTTAPQWFLLLTYCAVPLPPQLGPLGGEVSVPLYIYICYIV